MKRPLGVTLTVVWASVLLAAIVGLAAGQGEPSHLIAAAVPVFALACVVSGLWAGQAWAVRWFRVLLGVATVLAALLAAAALLGASLGHGPEYYIARSLITGAWLWYLFRPRVRAFFREVATPASRLAPGRMLSA